MSIANVANFPRIKLKSDRVRVLKPKVRKGNQLPPSTHHADALHVEAASLAAPAAAVGSVGGGTQPHLDGLAHALACWPSEVVPKFHACKWLLSNPLGFWRAQTFPGHWVMLGVGSCGTHSERSV